MDFSIVTGLHDLRADVIDKCRKLSQIFRKDHVWLTMDDMDLLRSAQLFKRDHETGKEGVTLAGILLLGRDDVILSVVPHHRTDLILRKVNIDRYDDRDFVDTNLVESYERIMAFIAKHLPDPFYLEKDMRKSIRDAIFREVASNIIIHREYLSAFPAKLIIERGIVRTENSNKPHGFGYIDPATFTPFPKNPNIARFFRQISRADELGSGVRNLMQYGKIYSGKNPILEENDIFRTTIYYPDFETTQKSEKKIFQNQVGAQNNNHSQAQQESQQESLRNRVLMLLINKELSKSEISRNLSHKKISGQLHPVSKSLLADGEIEYTIPEKPNSRMQKYRLTGRKKHTIYPS